MSPTPPQPPLRLPQRLHLRRAPWLQGLPGRIPARLPAARRVPADLPRRRHHRPVEPRAHVLLAAAAQRRDPHAARQGQARHASRLHSRQPRPPAARLRRLGARQRGGQARGAARDCRRTPLPGHAWRRVRQRDPREPVARVARQPGLRVRAAAQPPRQQAAAAPRLPVLVRRGLPEAQGQERGEVHRQLRACRRLRGAPPRRRRGHLRPHPPGRGQRHRRDHLLQRRRLGRKLHRAGRGRAWAARACCAGPKTSRC